MDNVERSQKKKIIDGIISIYNNAEVPSVSVTEYLISDLTECDICHCKDLEILKHNVTICLWL